MMQRALKVSAFLVILLMAAGQSWAADWVMSRVTGSVWLTSPQNTQQTAAEGVEVAAGWTVTTGPDSRVLLLRGSESIAIGANTIAVAQGDEAQTTISLQQGVATFDVQHRPTRSFAVTTPVLAAIVKGTNFTVSANADESNVMVTEGTVEVRALSTGEATMLTPGQTATVDAGNPGTLLLSEIATLGAGIVDGLTETAGGAVETLEETLEDVGDAAGDLLDGVEELISGAVSELLGSDGLLGDTVGGLLGGLGL